MLVREVMTTNVYSVRPDTTIDDALQVLTSHKITSVPVVTDDDEVVGIVSEADLLKVMISIDPRAQLIPVPPHEEPGQFVRDVMTKDPYVTRVGADVGDLTQVMARHGWKSVPVVHDARLVGMVSRSDIARALSRPDADIRHDVLAVLSEFGHPSWQVSMVAGEAHITGPTTPDEHAAARTAALSVSGVRRVSAHRQPG